MSRELDVLIDRDVMKRQPRFKAVASADGGKSAAMIEDAYASEAEIRAWVKEHAGYEVWLWPIVPHYSTDIAAAWEVVEKRCEDSQNYVEVTRIAASAPISRELGVIYSAVFATRNATAFRAVAKTAPEAICLAALKALGVEVPQEAKP